MLRIVKENGMNMKNVITAICLATIVALLGIAVVLLLGEPAEGTWWNTLMGIFTMKSLGIVAIIGAIATWDFIPEENRKALESWIKSHF